MIYFYLAAYDFVFACVFAFIYDLCTHVCVHINVYVTIRRNFLNIYLLFTNYIYYIYFFPIFFVFVASKTRLNMLSAFASTYMCLSILVVHL